MNCKNGTNDTTIRGKRNLFRLKKDNKTIKDKIAIDIINLFEHYKPVIVANFWSNNCIDYESNGNRNKTILVKEYLNEIRP